MYKIAIVDDEHHILDMLKTYLEVDYEVKTFENPVVALQNIKVNTYDLILCDIMMPQMNGLEFLKDLREFNPSVKVVMMTAFDSMDKALDAHEYGAKNYIKKPFDSLDVVEAKISNVIKQDS